MRDRSVLGALTDLFRQWWRVDRVRASPRHGALLRLEESAVLRASGRYLQVQAREVGESQDGPYVKDWCDDGGTSVELWVFVVGERAPPVVRWRCGAEEWTVSPTEIDVYG